MSGETSILTALEGIGLDKSECSMRADGGPCSSKKVIEGIEQFLETVKDDGKRVSSAAAAETEKLPSGSDHESKVVRRAAKVLGCDSESCVITRPEIKEIIGSSTVSKELAVNFKEIGPRNNVNWLNNVNIDRTLQKWAVEFEDLFVYPFCMSDFYKTRGSLARIKPSDVLAGNASQQIATGTITRKCKRMACVLNTDVSTGRGIHWVCVFVDCTVVPHSIEYWNSAGNPPFKSITRWMEESRADLMNYTGNPVNTYNVTSVQHQESDSECGVYSLFYIRKRLEGTPVSYFMDQRIPDKVMVEFRRYLFR